MVVAFVKDDRDFSWFCIALRLLKPDIRVPRLHPFALDVQWQRVAHDIAFGQTEAPLRELNPTLRGEPLIGQKSGKLALAACALGARIDALHVNIVLPLHQRAKSDSR